MVRLAEFSRGYVREVVQGFRYVGSRLFWRDLRDYIVTGADNVAARTTQAACRHEWVESTDYDALAHGSRTYICTDCGLDFSVPARAVSHG